MNPSHLSPPAQPSARREVPGPSDRSVARRYRRVQADGSETALDEALTENVDRAADPSPRVDAPETGDLAAAASDMDHAEVTDVSSAGPTATNTLRAATNTLADLPIGLLGVGALGAGAAVAASGGGSSRSLPSVDSPIPGLHPGVENTVDPGSPITPTPGTTSPPASIDLPGSEPQPKPETQPGSQTQPGPDSQPTPTPDVPVTGPRPASLTASLVNDSGASATDKITNDGTLAISGVIDGAQWQYSLDGGQSWTAGEGDRIASSALGNDGVKTVWLRQLDAQSVTSEMTAFTFELDTTAPQRLEGLLHVKFTPEGKAITTFSWDNLEAGAYWQYEFDKVNEWSSPLQQTTDQFIFSHGILDYRQIDVAGNASGRNSSLITSLTTSGDSTDQDVLTRGGNISTIGGFSYLGTYSLDDGVTWKSFEGVPNSSAWVLSESQIDGINGDRTIQIRTRTAIISFDFTLDRDNLRPSVALKNDSGESDTDRITNDGTVLVSGLKADTTWKYSVDNGTTWKAGGADHQIATTEFGPEDGVKTVQVIQTSTDGQDSAPRAFQFERITSDVAGVLAPESANPFGKAFTFTGDSGANRFIVTEEMVASPSTSNSRVEISGFNAAEGDVLDLSQILTAASDANSADYFYIAEDERVYLNLEGTGQRVIYDLSFAGLSAGNDTLKVIYDGGYFIL